MVLTSSYNLQFWLFTLGLLFLWAIVVSSASTTKENSQRQLLLNNEKESRMHERNCKSLCKQCGCMGFYCGEECICECNNVSSNTECINGMQNSAEKLNIPFQLLIQGPSRNRFVRKALKYGPNSHDRAALEESNRDKRSTVLIYEPTTQNSQQSRIVDDHKTVNNKDEGAVRQKRGVGQLDWFSDIANSLVRPAPLASRKKSSQSTQSTETVAQAQQKRGANRNEMDRSWFAENPNLLLRPAPLFKRQRNQADSENVGSSGRFNDEIDSYETPMRAVGKFPKVLKETLRSLQETATGSDTDSDFGDTLRSHIKEGANVLQSQLTDKNFEFLPTNGALRDNIQQTLSQIFTPNTDEERPPPLLQRSAPLRRMDRQKFTWFRPVRFLQRVQQAIN